MAFKIVESGFKPLEHSFKGVGLSRFTTPLIAVQKLATKRLTLRYGLAAILIAAVIIGSSIYLGPKTVKAQTNFAVMLTDPPNVPEGTTNLNVTYSDIQLHVIYSDGTSNWVVAPGSGKVDLLSIENVSLTIASLTLPTGSTVDRLQFKISSAKATIDSVVYPVNILSEQLVVNLKQFRLNGTNTGALIDLRPTLLQINAVDSTGAPVSYYVLVPSATAVLKSNVEEEHNRAGVRRRLEDRERKELDEEHEKASKGITIESATLKVVGDTMTLTVKLKNTGTKTTVVQGLTIHGDFNFVRATNGQGQGGEEHGKEENEHPRTIPFQVSDGELVPRIGDEDHHEDQKGLEVNPGELVTLTFSGVAKIQPDEEEPLFKIVPKVGSEYTIRVAGEGSQTFKVTASQGP